MITEDYVSFETAKLLKEKGFQAKCTACYHSGPSHAFQLVSGRINYCNPKFNKYKMIPPYNAPTLQMAMKWLREVHNLVIEPYRTACGYLYTISNIPYGSIEYDNSQAFNGDDENSGQWTTWEKACEDGIKYCLENLI